MWEKELQEAIKASVIDKEKNMKIYNTLFVVEIKEDN